jgi:hypothetical protein
MALDCVDRTLIWRIIQKSAKLTFLGILPLKIACGWRIHKITGQSASGTTRDRASTSNTKQSLSATQVRQKPGRVK